MGDKFRGFFTQEQDAANKAVERWTFLQLKDASPWMQGYMLRCPSEYDVDPRMTNEEYEKALEDVVVNACDLEEELPGFSKAYPETFFSFLETDCHGGACMYRGFSLLDGQKLDDFDDFEFSEEVLDRILEPMGLKAGHSARLIKQKS